MTCCTTTNTSACGYWSDNPRHSGTHPLQPSAEVFLPTLRQSRNLQRPPHRGHVGLAIPFFSVQTSDFRDRHAVWVPGPWLDLISTADFSLASHGQSQAHP